MFTNTRFTTKSFGAVLFMILAVLATVFSFAGHTQRVLAATNALPNDLTGTIAYMPTDGSEIRLIEADGTNDRRLWQVPDTTLYSINGTSWNPEANLLAFTSNHEQHCSIFRRDLFTIHPDGNNLQRITTRPNCSDLSSYPKGSVTVKIHNTLLLNSLVAVYVEGLPEAVTTTVTPGSPASITLNNVADFGDGVMQNVVVYAGNTTWIGSAAADVVAGSTVDAGELTMTNNNKGVDWGTFSPSWNRHGDRIAFALSDYAAHDIAANPGIGDLGTPMISGENSAAAKVVMSPVADEVLYQSNSVIYLAKVGEDGQKRKLIDSVIVFGGMDWLPDGSGFIFAQYNTFLGYGNLYEYRFDGATLTNLTNFNGEFAMHPSVSPDGNYVAFTYNATTEDSSVLKIIARDGSQIWDLGVQGHFPNWGKKASVPAVTPTATGAPVTATPVAPTATPTPGNPSTPVSTPTAVAKPDPATFSHKIYLPTVQR